MRSLDFAIFSAKRTFKAPKRVNQIEFIDWKIKFLSGRMVDICSTEHAMMDPEKKGLKFSCHGHFEY